MAHCAFEYGGGGVMCSGPSKEHIILNLDTVFAENLKLIFLQYPKR